MGARHLSVFNQIPDNISESQVINYMRNYDINWSYVTSFKEYTSLQDEVISDWLNISVRTLRNYKKPENQFKANIKEHLLLLMSLFKHGQEVIGSTDAFNEWLNTENFFFDGASPVTFLNTTSGIRFVEDRLTAMEYGDNV